MKKIHKYLGLILVLVMVWMGFSGIVLNHRKLFSTVDISRGVLPSSYLYDNWNYGFFKGSLLLPGDTVLLYGNEGVWLSDTKNSFIREWNDGMRSGADNRKVCRVITTSGGDTWCATLYYLYRLDQLSDKWQEIPLPDNIDRITDLETHEGKVILLTRSEVLISDEENNFTVRELPASPDMDEKRSLFRLVWTLHSGELFGTIGKLFVDFFAVIIIFLSITGLLIWAIPKQIRYRKKKQLRSDRQVRRLRFSFRWHNKTGYWLTLPLLIIVVTGAFLRPPLLITIVRQKITPPPFTTLRSTNSWHDLLRSVRYDKEQREWLLYTSEGFFTLATLDSTPRKMRHQAPVSVMGLNAWQQLDEQWWIVGSFNGFFVWNRYSGEVYDGFTGNPHIPRSGMPVGEYKISGYSADFDDRILVFLYDTGSYVFSQTSSFSTMPAGYQKRPMSLWNLALEMHTGRILTFLSDWSILYPFVLGILSVLMVFSGWHVYVNRNKKKM